ncbi:MAG: alanine--tRNA ligase, partial [Candidatus Omnitrophica bacterium]|nr:alanine--tRNA ligase [Candidatus Omnitrophota bacterium]
MKSNELRKSFLKFFEGKGHTIVSSSSLIPGNDPTLLFANAGMNQFKDIFLGIEKRGYVRAASVQKCIRVSGKHNDLEEIGKSTRHHTFFEMLGNWSFGDYYKKEAIEWAWEYLTGVLSIPKEMLWATIYEDDNEAGDIWKKVIGLPSDRIRRFGKKDNFWEMGETGPCGPCSEIHLDLGKELSCGGSGCGPNCRDCGRFIELWNLVFIQYNRNGSGELKELPAKHVDTGMGMERMLAFLQGVKSNYETDLFTPLISELEKMSRKDYAGAADTVPYRVIADHIRSLTFAIADGATPSNDGRGYVVRRILRRAARYGRKLNLHEPFLYLLVSKVVDIMADAYPDLREKAPHVSLIIKGEEEGFGNTLDRGLELFESLVKALKQKGEALIPGKEAFRLYDTYGFPLDLTELMAREAGMAVDRKGFDDTLQAQREASRGERPKDAAQLPLLDGETEFTGYESDNA